MSRRRELKGVASGLLEAFVSRNNDVGGYWGLGRLYSHALQNDALSVEIGLIAKSVRPFAGHLGDLLSRYSAALLEQCKVRSIPAGWIKEAMIRLTFNLDMNERDCPPKNTRGDLFECVFEIKDDLGHRYTASRLGWCAPHDPQCEVKSARPADAKDQR